MSKSLMLPESLTAENGAKAALCGEFHEEVEVENCDHYEDPDGEPESYTRKVVVSWSNIKKIWKAAVRLFYPQPQGIPDQMVSWMRCGTDGLEVRDSEDPRRRELCVKDPQRLRGYRVVATVYDNGVWHTWDHEGVGGENDMEDTVAKAKVEAAASAIAQGFI